MKNKLLFSLLVLPLIWAGIANAQTNDSSAPRERTFYRTGEVKRIPVTTEGAAPTTGSATSQAATQSAAAVSSEASVSSITTVSSSSEAMKPAAPAENEALYPPENSGGIFSMIMRYAGSVLSLVAGVGVLMFMKRRKKNKIVAAAAAPKPAPVAVPGQEAHPHMEAATGETQA